LRLVKNISDLLLLLVFDQSRKLDPIWVVSTKLTEREFDRLTQFAQELYIQGAIDLPTTSRLLRLIISSWINEKIHKET
jgi:hypothetical protein